MLLDTVPKSALDHRTVAEDALLAFARGEGAGMDDAQVNIEADELLRVFTACSEGLTITLAPLALPQTVPQTTWLTRRGYTFAFGWEQRLVGERNRHLVRAYQEARDGLWRWVYRDQAEELRKLLWALEHELARLMAADARQAFGNSAELAVWLDQRML